ncbi:MAG: hypothetical protein Q4G33_09400 [bacterium]|nr:hypothetical protein [bacterium]
MRYPIIQASSSGRGSTSSFKGLNRTDIGQDGEWAECDNLDTLHSPCLAPRMKHGAPLPLSMDGGLHGRICACAELIKDDGEYKGFTGVLLCENCIDDNGDTITNFCFAYNGSVRHIGTESSLGSHVPERTALWLYDAVFDDIAEEELTAFESDMERVEWTVAAVGGRYVINGFDPVLRRGRYFVFDPRKMYDTISKEKERLVVQSGIQAKYTRLTFGKANALSHGFSEYKYINYIQSDSKTMDFSDMFCEGDYLLISDVTNSDGETSPTLQKYQTYPYRKSGRDVKYAVIREIEKVYGSSGDFLYQRIYYYATSPSGKFVENEYHAGLNVTLGTFVPPMQHIAVFGKRIWGVDPDEDRVYASVFDTPFKLMNTDRELDNAMAWQLTPGTADEAVGMFPAGTEMLVMKKNSIIRINGASASSFMLAGIFKNCGCIDINSCAEAAGTVYYLGFNGFYAYDGSQPVIISHKLNCRYSSAYGFSDGIKYYASAVRADNDAHEFLVYDIRSGIWLKWSGTPKACGFVLIGNDVYLCCNDTEGHIIKLCGGSDPEEWSCESVRMFENANSFKAVNELWLRGESENGIRVLTSVNGGEFKEHKTLEPKGRPFVYKIPVRLLPGDFWSYRLCGSGSAVIHNIERVYEEGGERHYAH